MILGLHELYEMLLFCDISSVNPDHLPEVTFGPYLEPSTGSVSSKIMKMSKKETQDAVHVGVSLLWCVMTTVYRGCVKSLTENIT